MPARSCVQPPAGAALAGCGRGALALHGLLFAFAAPAQAADAVLPAATAAPRYQLEAGLTHDDNLTRGRVGAEKRSDQTYAAQLSRDWDFLLAPTTRIVLTATAGGEAFGRYTRLNRVFGEGQAALEYRASGDFSAPTFGLFVRAAADAFRSTLRSGQRYAVGASVGAALTDRINALGVVGFDTRHARSEVFGGHTRSARLNLDYALSDAGTLYLGGDYRRGDTTASGLASLENIDIAKVFVTDDAFGADPLLSYRFEARTVVATLGYNHGLGSRASFDVAWRHARTTPRFAPPFASSVPNRYLANQLALSVLWRF